MKKILSALLILAMLCLNLTLPAMADVTVEEFTNPEFYYNFDFSGNSIPTGITGTTNSKVM